MLFKQKNFLHSSLSSGLTIHSCYAPKCSGSNGYGCLDRAPLVQSPCAAGFSETLSEKFPTTLPVCSNNLTVDNNSLVFETSTGQRAILRYSVQISDVGISTSITLFFCSAETSSGYSSPFILLSSVRDVCTRASLP